MAVGKQHPYMGVLFFAGILALAGIPPTNGFISKLSLFNSGVNAGMMLSLAVIALASILTLIYTIRAFIFVWWMPATETIPYKKGDSLLAPTILIALALLLGIWANPLVHTTLETAQWLSDAQSYIQAVLGTQLVMR
jgi:formate hydrogenlyase subunit 3/multisubunit Na+/H+ antiporter MnhD subunit